MARKLESDPQTWAWSRVVLFYAARDIAHAVFAEEPGLAEACRHPRSHTNPDLAQPGTNAVINRHFRVISAQYLELYSVSTAVRYQGQSIDERTLADLNVTFDEVRQWASKLLRAAGRQQLPAWLTA